MQAADAKQAIAAGRLASRVVSAAFPDPMDLKFERVCLPFLLLHVNRWVRGGAVLWGRLCVDVGNVGVPGKCAVQVVSIHWWWAAWPRGVCSRSAARHLPVSD